MAKKEVLTLYPDDPSLGLARGKVPQGTDTYLFPDDVFFSTGVLTSEVNSGAGNTAFTLDTEATFSAGDLIDIQNNGTSRFSIDHAGDISSGSNWSMSFVSGTTLDIDSALIVKLQSAGADCFSALSLFNVDELAGYGTAGVNFASARAAGGAQYAWRFKTKATTTGTGGLAAFQDNSTTKCSIEKDGAINSQAGIGLHGTTAPAQHTSTGNTSVTAAGSTNTVFRNTTFTGGSGTKAYTIGDIVLALKNVGIMAAS